LLFHLDTAFILDEILSTQKLLLGYYNTWFECFIKKSKLPTTFSPDRDFTTKEKRLRVDTNRGLDEVPT
jgi:hypothetical protein